MEVLIKTSQQQDYYIKTEDTEVIDWINMKESCSDIILHQINNDRMYDPIFMGRKDMTVVDLGANMGFFSLYAQDSASRIVAVEPAPRTYNILQKLTKDIANITTVQAAIGNSNSAVEFFINENPTVNSLLDRRGTAISVPGMTLQQLFETHNLTTVDFCKCDIEGSEMVAITEETLDPVRDVVKFWFMEVHQTDVKQLPWPGNLGQNRDYLAGVLRNMGYQTELVINDQLYAWR
jgi:FkbM family methyltransferase